jgi:hypothetical protein
MATPADSIVGPTSSLLRAFYRPPFIGIMAFIAALFVIPLAHALMVLTEYIFGESRRYTAAFVMGAVSIYLLWIGVKLRREAIGTWLGFFAGTLIWTSWVEFGLMYYGRALYGVPVQIENGAVIQDPEYMMMTTSIGMLMASLAYLFFNKDTRCNFFVWFHRRLNLQLGERGSGRDRNIAAITFMETVYVTWFFYLAQLAIYDPSLIGADSWVAYAAFFVCFVWGVYLFSRLVKYRRVSSAVRYAIPTSIILWCDVEFMSRWNMLTEVWLRPWDFVLECSLLLAGCIIVTILVMRSPKKLSELEVS